MADGWVYLRRCSASLISDRITMRYYLMFVEMVLIKGKQKVTVGEHVEKRQPLDTVGGNLNQCSCCGNSWEVPQNLETEYCLMQQFHFWVYIRRDCHQDFEGIAVFPHWLWRYSQWPRLWKHSKCPSVE